jgi:hypothetical protein
MQINPRVQKYKHGKLKGAKGQNCKFKGAKGPSCKLVQNVLATFADHHCLLVVILSGILVSTV